MKNKSIKIQTIIKIILIATICMPISYVQAANTDNSSNITSTSIAGTSNANLSNLGLTKYDFTGFKPNETSYDTIVPEDVTSVEVYAKTQDSSATYSVSGNKNLKAGINKITITVTASDGRTKKEYYINVRRLGDATENTEENIEQTQETEMQDQSNITRYSTPHTEVGWYIIGISLAIVTILLIIFIIIDDYKPEKKQKRKKKSNLKNPSQQIKEERQEQYKNNYNTDSQATKILNLNEIKNMKSTPNFKGKHSK